MRVGKKVEDIRFKEGESGCIFRIESFCRKFVWACSGLDGAINGRDERRSAASGMDAEGTAIPKQVEDAFLRTKFLDGKTSIALIQKKSRLLSMQDIGKKPQTGFLEQDGSINEAVMNGDGSGIQIFLSTNGQIRSFNDDAWLKDGVKCLDDFRAQSFHPGGMQLEHADISIPINDESRNPVRFCVDNAIARCL